MENKLTEAFKQGFKKEAQSLGNATDYAKDFAAGVEPTGVFTFGLGQQHAEEGGGTGDYTAHQVAGGLGGFAGGAISSLALTGLGLTGLGKAFKGSSPEFAQSLQQAAKDQWNALNPSKVKQTFKAGPEASEIVRKRNEVAGEFEPALRSDNPMMELNTSSMNKAEDVSQQSKQFQDTYGQDPSRTYEESIGTLGGLASAGLGGGLSASSAVSQFESGTQNA